MYTEAVSVYDNNKVQTQGEGLYIYTVQWHLRQWTQCMGTCIAQADLMEGTEHACYSKACTCRYAWLHCTGSTECWGTGGNCYSNQSHLDNVILSNGVNLSVGFRQRRVRSLQRDLALRHIELLYTGPQWSLRQCTYNANKGHYKRDSIVYS